MQNKKIIYCIILITLLCSFTLPCLSFTDNYTWSVLNPTLPTSTSLSDLPNISANNFLNLDAGSAILIEQNTGQILYEHNIHER